MRESRVRFWRRDGRILLRRCAVAGGIGRCDAELRTPSTHFVVARVSRASGLDGLFAYRPSGRLHVPFLACTSRRCGAYLSSNGTLAPLDPANAMPAARRSNDRLLY